MRSGVRFATTGHRRISPMSRVERTENPNDRQRSEQSRQSDRGRGSNAAPREEPAHTPSKAEGELGDVEQALKNQNG
jgi:hypothetical protein